MSNLRAALVLKLDDKSVSSGLEGIKKEFDKLKSLGKELTLGKLDDAPRTLEKVASSARDLARELRGVSNAAEQTHGRLSRIGQTIRGWGSGAMNLGKNIAAKLGPAGGALLGAAEGVAVGHMIGKYGELDDKLRRVAMITRTPENLVPSKLAHWKAFVNDDARKYGQTGESIADTLVDLLRNGVTEDRLFGTATAHTRAATAFHTTAAEFTPVTAALVKSFGVGEEQLPQALAAVGLAANRGRMSVSDFSSQFPGIAGSMNKFGMTGLANANRALAALQTVMRNSSNPGAAGAEMLEGLNYIFSNAGMHAFEMKLHRSEVNDDIKKLMDRALGSKGFTGINLHRLKLEAEKKGINPIEMLVDKLSDMKERGHLSQTESGDLFTALMHNETAGRFWSAVVQYKEDFRGLQRDLNAITPSYVDETLRLRMGGPAMESAQAKEGVEQLERRAGEGFSIILKPINSALDSLLGTIEKLDDGNKKIVDSAAAVVAGLGGLAAALGVLGWVAPAVKAGAGLVAAGGVGAWGLGATALQSVAAPFVGLGLLAVSSAWAHRNDDPDSLPGTGHGNFGSGTGAGQKPLSFGDRITAADFPGGAPSFNWGSLFSRVGHGEPTEIVIRAAPGTEVISASGPANVRVDPGRTVGKP